MNTRTLTPEQFHKMDAYWRAANYLSVGQIYLYDNPLLKRPLTLADVMYMLVWSKYSCGFPMVIFQQPTQSFLFGCGVRPDTSTLRLSRWIKNSTY